MAEQGAFTRSMRKKKLPYLAEARDRAWDALTKGQPGAMAVEAALRVMEECPYFNAGYGGYPNVNGIVLLDVGLMSGNRGFVSIVNMRRVKYPSSVALDMMSRRRAIMTVWTHELMQELDTAAPEIKERYGVVEKHEDLVAPFVKELLGKAQAAEVSSLGTVGCVVRDASGRLFAGTSTGGVNLKSNGRIGDSPIIGSGVFADDEVCALSTTGHGESFMRSLFSGFVIAEMRRLLRNDPQVFARGPENCRALLENEFDEMKRKAPGTGGGIIIIPAGGEPTFSFNSEMLSVAFRSSRTAGPGEAMIALADGRALR
jgi:beta-aspartyl-peptidase (threonine type)